ncbi:hypothetical protein PanWU01x14_258270 [Parasponia andersonii]|uniref:Uncharacterized protein n=1 Tax=Parasponia andersonii TaxID=3476 RepID=A0A2P5B9M1_PARAD|nr:hypothetical protein PanWU01x14_258270 [Parasponia andersonii]
MINLPTGILSSGRTLSREAISEASEPRRLAMLLALSQGVRDLKVTNDLHDQVWPSQGYPSDMLPLEHASLRYSCWLYDG